MTFYGPRQRKTLQHLYRSVINALHKCMYLIDSPLLYCHCHSHLQINHFSRVPDEPFRFLWARTAVHQPAPLKQRVYLSRNLQAWLISTNTQTPTQTCSLPPLIFLWISLCFSSEPRLLWMCAARFLLVHTQTQTRVSISIRSLQQSCQALWTFVGSSVYVTRLTTAEMSMPAALCVCVWGVKQCAITAQPAPVSTDDWTVIRTCLCADVPSALSDAQLMSMHIFL